MTATFVKNLKGFTGEAKLFRLDKPLGGSEFVAVSATVAMFSGPETYIFPADSDGKVTDWLELDGSFQGGLDINLALENAGYKVL